MRMEERPSIITPMDNFESSEGEGGRSAFDLNRQTPYLRLHHVSVFVRDQDRSLRFYLEQLGFSLVIDFRFGDRRRFVVVSPPDGSALLALLAPEPESREYQRIGQSTEIVFVTEDVMAQFELWRERGVHFRDKPQTASWGGTSAIFEDLDGNSFGLAGWDQISTEVEARRRAIAERLEAERHAAQELAIAKQVQRRLFPQTAPAFASFRYAGVCIQARDVGGDYFDFLDLGQQRLGLVVGDISGKGIAAALVMANLQANLRSQFAIAVEEPVKFLQSVNRLFYGNTIDSVYATLFFAEYDDKSQRLRYANCGHLSGLLVRRDQTVEWLASTGTVLGLFKEWVCSLDERQLFPGDTLVLYTDGITESFHSDGEDFGEERLLAAVLRHADAEPEDLIQALVEEVRAFSPGEQRDDITVIVAKCR